MDCAKKISEKCSTEFYKNDKTCKECRKLLVRQNRKNNIDYYRKYDRDRSMNPDRVKAREDYANSEGGKASAKKAKKNWQLRNQIKRAANVMVGNAVRDGKLTKPDTCEDCGSTPTRLHGHHDDYAYPLVVRWLCPGCHNKWHKENGEGLNAS